ncbi:MAG: hypothetical protein Q9170_001939, partial [Blastenia crenularia]
FRVSYTLNLTTGQYHTHHPSATLIPNDVPLTAYGVEQSHSLATALAALDPRIEYIYSSPFYRCLQTIAPAMEKLGPDVRVRVDGGIGFVSPLLPSRGIFLVSIEADGEGREWYGPVAHFVHPSPASVALLATKYFPSLRIDESCDRSITPSPSGETIAELHDRVACALDHIITCVDEESGDRDTAILLCTHAATLIAIGRALTGRMPEDVCEEDFLTPCAGVTKFVRRERGEVGWECVLNGECGHLKGGAERMWHFMGEETFDSVPSDLEAEPEDRRSKGVDDPSKGIKSKI